MHKTTMTFQELHDAISKMSVTDRAKQVTAFSKHWLEEETDIVLCSNNIIEPYLYVTTKKEKE